MTRQSGKERKTKCSRRKTSKGLPYRCYATKKERCAEKALMGQYDAICHSGLFDRTTPIRRPVGNPIDACVVEYADLATMTMKQIQNFMRKNHILIPSGPLVTKGTKRLRKAELIQAVLNAKQCPATFGIPNPQTATTRDFGLALKYRHIVPPTYGDAASCGAVQPGISQLRFNMIGKGKKTPCKAQLRTMALL
ncbi:MAG: hypothetical protein P4L69_07095 [Desulfosporosinus sp.]|nr:hypothetical protein [Desulfosporosinus sp.]